MITDCKTHSGRYIKYTGITKAYIEEVRNYDVISPQEQKRLLSLAHNSDNQVKQEAINRLVQSNQRFIISFAKKWSQEDNLLDVINEANLGLLEAIDKYDTDSDNNFLTYAVWWIRKYVKDYHNVYDNIVKRPNANKHNLYVPKARRWFENKYHREPTNEELIEILHKKYNYVIQDPTDLDELRPYTIDNSDIDNELNLCETDRLFNEKTAVDNVSSGINDEYTKSFVSFLLGKLSDTERDVIVKNYGIGCFPKTVDSIADELNIPSYKVRSILKKTHNKLKQYENFN
jgi:RNA polymerase sigma factor (sigma-70 family)